MTAPQRLLVLGATGLTGRHIVDLALAQGHTITAVARNTATLDIPDPRLTPVAVDLTTDLDAVGRLVPGHDAVICALGRGLKLRSNGLMTRTTPGILAGMQRQGVRRLVYLSAAGVGEPLESQPFVSRLMIRFLLADIYADKAPAERLVQSSRLDWTILAPVALSNGPATARMRVEERPKLGGLDRISRADVAVAVLNCLNDPKTFQRRYVVAPPD
jgi:uncharacterized protein YbjT (DUF2867 family)